MSEDKFTLISLSNGSDHYTFKIKIKKEQKDDLKDVIEKISKIKDFMIEKNKEKDIFLDQNIFSGELIGVDYVSTNKLSKEFMINELNKWTNYFKSSDFEVYDIKILSLKTRLSELDKQNPEIKKIIDELS